MPPVFFFFIGTVTGGFSDSIRGEGTPLELVAQRPGFLQSQLERRMREQGFEPRWMTQPTDEADGARLYLGGDLSARVVSGEPVSARYSTKASALSRDYELIRLQRDLYTVLADLAVAPTPDAAGIAAVNAAPRIWTIDAAPGGARREVPRGFDQAIPGMLVMFTLLVLLTSGASMLAVERGAGLLRRLASTPITREELVAGKWLARMGLAAVQIVAAMAAGSWLFSMAWGPEPAMLLVLTAWAALCASAGMLLGSLARTEAQAVGLGILVANVLAALGGCWWPIEITPPWMQFVQKLVPTGWTMDAVHKLISFEAGVLSAVPYTLALVLGAAIIGWLAARSFRYQ